MVQRRERPGVQTSGVGLLPCQPFVASRLNDGYHMDHCSGCPVSSPLMLK